MQWSEKQREAIEDRGHNLLVSAAAGSGKTAVLVERIKGLLLKDHIRLTEMLIVTFSNAAAAEMREKIAAALQAEMEREDCGEADRRFLRDQLNSMHKANISTFHAFAMEVIRRYFYLIDAEPSFRICDEAQKTILQGQAMEELFQREFDEKRPEFLRFLDWYATGKSEQDVKDMVFYVHNFIQSMPEPFRWLKEAAEALKAGKDEFFCTEAWKYRTDQKEQLQQLALKYFQRVYDRLEEEGIASLLIKAQADLDAVEACLAAEKANASVNVAAEKANAGANVAAEKANAGASVAAEMAAEKANARADAAEIKAVKQGAETENDGTDVKGSADAAQGVGAGTETDVGSTDGKALRNDNPRADGVKFSVFAAAKADKEAYAAVREEITALRNRGKELWNQARTLYGESGVDAQIEAMNATAWAAEELYRLTEAFDGLYREKKEEKNLLDFSDIEHYALRILRRPEAAREYREAFACIFIDEYQDSNVIQEELIGCIARENNVFMVGDVKQSIYKFRLAEPEIFLNKYELYRRNEAAQADEVQRESRSPDESEALRESGSLAENGATEGDEASKENEMPDGAGTSEGKAALGCGGEASKNTGASGKKIDLNLNFRCKGNIIKTTNQIFGAVMTKRSTGITYDEDAALHKGLAYEGELDYSSLLHIVDVKADVENDDPQIAELVSAEVEAMQAARLVKESIGTPIYDCKKNEVRPLRKRDIVILLRGVKGYGDLYAKALMELGIESFMDNSDGYFDTLEIQIFLNLLRIVDNKRQDVALLSVLRSPVFGFTIAELAEIRAAHRDGSYFDALQAMAEQAAGRDGTLAENRYEPERGELRQDETAQSGVTQQNEAADLPERCRAVLARLALWQEKASFMPLAEFLQMLIEETGYGSYVGAIAGGAQRLANVNAMVDKAIQYEASSGKGLFGFIRYIEAVQKGKVKTGQVRMIGENDDVVRIMTIHKSKGLEFPFVLIGGLGRSFNRRKETAKVACHKDLGLGLRYVMPDQHAYQKTLLKQLIDQRLVQDDMAEEIRILYVGFTRAQDRLMLLAGVKGADRLREQRELRLPEDSAGAGCYLDMIFPWIDGGSMEIRYSDRSLLSVQQREDSLRREDVVRSVREGFEDSGCDNAQREEIERRLSFVYEDSGRNELKTKYTVSELAFAAQSDGGGQRRGGSEPQDSEGPRAGAEPDAEGPAAEIDWRQAFSRRPAFLEAKELTAADRGTIYHRVMECIPFDRQWSAEEVREFVDSMVKRELISAEEAAQVIPGRISAFFLSPLGKRIAAASKVQKEVPFNLKMEKDGHTITVQGMIDCYFPEGDGVVLVDYKSNFVDNRREEEDVQRLASRYRPQLLMYRQALEEISGVRVKEMYLYLFSAEKAVKIELPGEERNCHGTADQ